jgi:hypothetical protein
MIETRAKAALALAIVFLARPAPAQIGEGKCETYFDFDPATGVRDEYPALKIDDLRKLTLYSKLAIRGPQAVIADDRHMRKIEPHAQQKELLIVTSDHFQFTVLKDGNLVAAGVPPASRKALQLAEPVARLLLISSTAAGRAVPAFTPGPSSSGASRGDARGPGAPRPARARGARA